MATSCLRTVTVTTWVWFHLTGLLLDRSPSFLGWKTTCTRTASNQTLTPLIFFLFFWVYSNIYVEKRTLTRTLLTKINVVMSVTEALTHTFQLQPSGLFFVVFNQLCSFSDWSLTNPETSQRTFFILQCPYQTTLQITMKMIQKNLLQTSFISSLKVWHIGSPLLLYSNDHNNILVQFLVVCFADFVKPKEKEGKTQNWINKTHFKLLERFDMLFMKMNGMKSVFIFSTLKARRFSSK